MREINGRIHPRVLLESTDPIQEYMDTTQERDLIYGEKKNFQAVQRQTHGTMG